MKFSRVLPAAAVSVFTLWANTTLALDIQTYNAADKGIFPVSSELIVGQQEAILVDAQFDTANATRLVEMIRASGKKLTTIYISGGDPDYYFGVPTIKAAFPDAKVIASHHVVEHINKTKDAKLAYWGPILGASAPASVMVPAIDDRTELTLDGETIEVKHINTEDAYLWVPSQQTVLGGVAVSSALHVWMADSQTREARDARIAVMNEIISLKPKQVIPGHYLGDVPAGAGAAVFTRDYIARFEANLAKAADAAALEQAMKADYPALPVDNGLTISTKVAKGEMSW